MAEFVLCKKNSLLMSISVNGYIIPSYYLLLQLSHTLLFFGVFYEALFTINFTKCPGWVPLCSAAHITQWHITLGGWVHGTLARLPWSGEPYFIHWPHHPDICGHTMELHSTLYSYTPTVWRFPTTYNWLNRLKTSRLSGRK